MMNLYRFTHLLLTTCHIVGCGKNYINYRDLDIVS